MTSQLLHRNRSGLICSLGPGFLVENDYAVEQQTRSITTPQVCRRVIKSLGIHKSTLLDFHTGGVALNSLAGGR